MSYQYKMIQVPPEIPIRGAERQAAAANYLQNLANEQARGGWNYQGVDMIGAEISPGCLGALFGRSKEYAHFFIVTFRREDPSGER